MPMQWQVPDKMSRRSLPTEREFLMMILSPIPDLAIPDPTSEWNFFSSSAEILITRRS
jgi:hypothetical protein